MKLRFVMLSAALLACAVANSAQAQSYGRMVTILKSARPEIAEVTETSKAAMVRGFAACDPRAALPRPVLESLGVVFLRNPASLPFSDAAQHRAVVLEANGIEEDRRDPGTGEHVRSYAGHYRLDKSVRFNDVALRAVGQVVEAGQTGARVGITYRFDRITTETVPALVAAYGVRLREEPGSVPGIRFVESPDLMAITCWRTLD